MPKRKTPPTPKKTPTKRARKVSGSRKPPGLRNNFVLGNHDARVDFVAKPKKYNAAAKRFQDKVMKVLYKKDPKVLHVVTIPTTDTNVTATTEQCWQIFHMRPWEGSSATPGSGKLFNEPAQDDIRRLIDNLNSETALATDSIKILRSEMEISLNTGAGGVFEVYEIVYLKRDKGPMTATSTFNAALVNAISNVQVPSGSGASAISLNRRGVTPFDITSLVKDYGIKVIKKSVFLVAANQGLNYRMVDYSHDVFDKSILLSVGTTSGFCLPGATRSALVIYKPLATESTGGFNSVCNKRYQVQYMLTKDEPDVVMRD